MNPLYWSVPTVVVLLLVASVVRRRRSSRRDPFLPLLLVGLPVAAVAFFVAFGLVDDPQPTQYEQLTRGEHADLRVGFLVVSAEALLSWLVVLAVTPVLTLVRGRRHAKRGGEGPPALRD